MNILINKNLTLNNKEIALIEDLGHSFVEGDCKDVDFWITSASSCNKKHLEYPDLKFVQLTSAGYDSLDLEALQDRGITVMNARDVHSPPIAEYILAYILTIYKRTFHYKALQNDKDWNTDLKLDTLNEKRVMFLGAGSIAQATAKLLTAFGAHTLGLNSDGRTIQGFSECMSLEEGLKQIGDADIVVSTLPSSEATYHLLDYDTLKLMNESSILINIGRGDVIDEDALLKVLDKTIRHAVLDVFEEEPLSKDSKLWNHFKVIITPHLSYSTPDSNSRHASLFINQIKNISSNKKVLNIISK